MIHTLTKATRLAASIVALSALKISAQQPITLQINGNGVLQWADASSAFVKASSYTIEWASQLQHSNNRLGQSIIPWERPRTFNPMRSPFCDLASTAA